MDPLLHSYLLLSLVYGACCLCFVSPPPAVSAAGLTIQNIFYGFLGSQFRDYFQYQLRRTALTRLVHLILLEVFAGGSFLFFAAQLDVIAFPKTLLHLFLLLAASVGLWSAWQIHVISHWLRDLSRHPATKSLSIYHNDWEVVAANITEEVANSQFEFTGVGNNQLKITTSWIVQCTAYQVHVAHQRDVDLSIVSSHEVLEHRTGGPPTPTQILNIKVTSIHRECPEFHIALHALDYNILRSQLDREIRNVKAIIIQQPLSEQFLTALKQIVAENTRRANLEPESTTRASQQNDGERDTCVGCMTAPVDVRSRRSCSAHPVARHHEGPVNHNSPCSDCFCRSFWCLECLGKWFLSQQDQRHPDQWMYGKIRCPTCRAVYCLLDVVYLDLPNQPQV